MKEVLAVFGAIIGIIILLVIGYKCGEHDTLVDIKEGNAILFDQKIYTCSPRELK